MPTPAAKPKYYLTTPIYYTNGLPHIGHTYSTIVCDTIRRYKRMRGYDVVMTTGTDEHGVNVERRREKAGMPAAGFVDGNGRAVAEDSGTISASRATNSSAPPIRCTPAPCNGSSNCCRENGYIYKGHYTGQYCVFDNAYVNDAGPGDPCPDCGTARPKPSPKKIISSNFPHFRKVLLDYLRRESRFHPARSAPQRSVELRAKAG